MMGHPCFILLKVAILGMYRNDGTSQKGNCIELTGLEGVSIIQLIENLYVC